MTDFVYTPSAWGARYHACDVWEVLGAGSAGPGKSLVLLMDPLQQIQVEHDRCCNKNHSHPLDWGDSVGWALHLRREFPMLELSIARSHKIFPRIDPDVRWDSQKHTWLFKSGYRFQFGHCKNTDDWIIYDSFEFTHMAFDELVQFEEEQYTEIGTRLRTADPVLEQMLKLRSMSNPVRRREGTFNASSGDPQWVRARFVDPEPAGNIILDREITLASGRKVIRSRLYMPARLSDNPNKEFVKQYEETLSDKPPHIRSALLDGNWYNVSGSFFGDDWNDAIHMCKPFRIPHSYKRFRSMDWGFKTYGTVIWFAMDDDGNLYAEREFTFKDMSPKKVAQRVKDIEMGADLWTGSRSAITGPADTQLWERRGESSKSKAEEMAEVGVHWVPADKTSRARNAELFLNRLRDHEHGTKQPGIVFFENCKQCRRTIPAIPTDPKDSEVPVDGGDDHWLDAVLYACAYASRGRAGIPAVRKKDTERDDDDRDTRRKHKRDFGYGTAV